MHNGINETYNSLKDKIYSPKLRDHIQLRDRIQHSFITTIEKLTKFAAAYSITDRNWRA